MKVDNKTYNNNSAELGFYKFYYQLIYHWLYSGNEYKVFLDYKINANRHRVSELGRILQSASPAKVSFTQALPSEQSLAIQLADILTGAITAKFNGEITSKAKLDVISFIESYLGHEISQTQKDERKFNIFNINLRQDW